MWDSLVFILGWAGIILAAFCMIIFAIAALISFAMGWHWFKNFKY